MNKREKAIVSAYTGYLVGDFADMHQYAEELFGGAIFSHQFGNKSFAEQLRKAAKADFVALSDSTEDELQTKIAELEQEKKTLIKLAQDDSRYLNLLSETQYLRAKVEEMTDVLEHIREYENIRTAGRPFSSAVFNIADNCLKDDE